MSPADIATLATSFRDIYEGERDKTLREARKTHPAWRSIDELFFGNQELKTAKPAYARLGGGEGEA